jgi:hypothetical protein
MTGLELLSGAGRTTPGHTEPVEGGALLVVGPAPPHRAVTARGWSTFDWRVWNLLNQPSFQDMRAVKLIRVWTTFASFWYRLSRGAATAADQAVNVQSN